MYTANVLLGIQKFVSMTGIFGQSPTIVATIAPPRDTSALPPAKPVFSGNGETIVVTVPSGYLGSVQLTYQLPDPKYVLLGLAFKGPNGGVGRLEFRSVAINRDVYGSQLTVTDACVNQCVGIEYTYVILVQEVASGNIGLIDPGIENENGD
jgi:hypothetical protein